MRKGPLRTTVKIADVPAYLLDGWQLGKNLYGIPKCSQPRRRAPIEVVNEIRARIALRAILGCHGDKCALCISCLNSARSGLGI